VFSEALLDHFRNPRHVGELPAPAVTVEVTNPACGDILRLSAAFDGDRVIEARYKVRGCTASIAAGSALAEMMVGMSCADLKAISTSAIEERLGELPPASKHAAALCVDGVKALLKRLLSATTS
jgi:nitrogen fixation NifU-like protein